MASYGYMGKIAVVDLTDKSVSFVDTADYEDWVGGHGLASALFWDYCDDKTVGPLDPGNVLCFCASPFSGTLVPAAGARIEVTGIGAFSPAEWYTRSSIGGRISGSMRRSGLDGMVVKGKASEPVWINVIEGEVSIEDASGLWGLDSFETQEKIWQTVMHGHLEDDWFDLDGTRDGGRTIQKPGVLAIGQLGEAQGRMAAIMHDAGHAAAQSGFGAVMGSKNLKAISFYGTQAVTVADPSALIDLRAQVIAENAYNPDAPAIEPRDTANTSEPIILRTPGKGFIYTDLSEIAHGPEACEGCFAACRSVFPDAKGNEGFCVACLWAAGTEGVDGKRKNVDMLNRYGVNGFLNTTIPYLYSLYSRGIAGPDCKVETGDLDWAQYGTPAFNRTCIEKMIRQEDCFADLADGAVRAAMKWGTYDEDSASGVLAYPNWGYQNHYDAYIETDWSFGSILGDRDINEHNFNFWIFWMPRNYINMGLEPLQSPEELAQMLSEYTHLDPKSFDYSEENTYSDDRVAAIAFLRHYARFWTQSMCLCDWGWTWVNYQNPDGDYFFDFDRYQNAFYEAVLGKEMTHEKSLDLGYKMWTLDKAIWTLQGRTKEQEVFADYVYDVPNTAVGYYPGIVDGKWDWVTGTGRTLDRKKFEDFKSRFYEYEGWNAETGWPTRSTLESLGLKHVADTLEEAGKLGAE